MYKKNEDLYPGKYKTYINSHKTSAAITIQRVWRKYKTYINSRKTSAAITIQKAWKKYIFNKNSRSGSLIGRFFSWFCI